MTQIESFIRDHIREMPAYQPVVPREVLAHELGRPISDLIKLDANENPFGPLPAVFDELGRLANLHLYPDPEARKLRHALAQYHQIPEERIVAGAGADELIDLILRILIDPGDRVINCPPTFGMYAFDGRLNQAQIINIPRNDDFSLDLSALEDSVRAAAPKVIFLANPNNPDGGLIPSCQVERILDLPCLVVIDEAYIEFSRSENSALQFASQKPNVVVLRTFSKWAGLAGLRIGYGVFPPPLAAALMKSKQPYNISVTAEHAAMVTLEHREEADRNLEIIRLQRERLNLELSKIPWLEPYPSEANFIFCKVNGFPASEINNRLREEGILIRYFNAPGLDDHIRISIGTPTQMDALIRALKGIE